MHVLDSSAAWSHWWMKSLVEWKRGSGNQTMSYELKKASLIPRWNYHTWWEYQSFKSVKYSLVSCWTVRPAFKPFSLLFRRDHFALFYQKQVNQFTNWWPVHKLVKFSSGLQHTYVSCAIATETLKLSCIAEWRYCFFVCMLFTVQHEPNSVELTQACPNENKHVHNVLRHLRCEYSR